MTRHAIDTGRFTPRCRPERPFRALLDGAEQAENLGALREGQRRSLRAKIERDRLLDRPFNRYEDD